MSIFGHNDIVCFIFLFCCVDSVCPHGRLKNNVKLVERVRERVEVVCQPSQKKSDEYGIVVAK